MEPGGLVPAVSVVVPASGSAEELPLLLDSLQKIAYPPERREIIVVDNGLTDEARASLGRWPITVLQEPCRGCPGLARNRGARAARGEVLVFVDADCVVDEQWLREGVGALIDDQADVASGRIVFRLSAEQRAAEIFDSLVHMRNDILIKRRGVVVSANLFVRRDAFLATGGFPSGYAGEDFLWAQRARERGVRLVYGSRAVAYHPARRLRALLEKARRVAPYSVMQYRDQRTPVSRLRHQILSSVLPSPAHLLHVWGLIKGRGEPWMRRKVLSVTIVSYLYGLWWAATVVREIPDGPPPETLPIPDRGIAPG